MQRTKFSFSSCGVMALTQRYTRPTGYRIGYSTYLGYIFPLSHRLQRLATLLLVWKSFAPEIPVIGSGFSKGGHRGEISIGIAGRRLLCRRNRSARGRSAPANHPPPSPPPFPP